MFRDPLLLVILIILWALLLLFILFPLASSSSGPSRTRDASRSPGCSGSSPIRSSARPSGTASCWRRSSASAGRSSGSSSPTPPSGRTSPRGGFSSSMRRSSSADLAPLHDGDRDDLLLRPAGADHLRPPRDHGLLDLRPPQHALLRDDHLLPDRLSDAQGDPRRDRPHRGGHGLQPGELPLAGLPDGDAAPDRAGDRERLSAAVRGLARRFRDAAHPGRKQLSHPPHPGLPPDHGALRPEGRGGPLLRPAGPGLRGLSPPAVLGEPEVLRDDHRKGGRQDRDQKRPALDADTSFWRSAC